MPETMADQDNAFIRWAMASDTSVDNGDISSSGTNRLDDVIITGVNLSPQRVEVYPGDANNDSLVKSYTIIPYELSDRTHVCLEILNIHGQVVATVVDKVQNAGKYNVRFIPSNLSPGIYLYRLKTNSGYTECRKMNFIK